MKSLGLKYITLATLVGGLAAMSSANATWTFSNINNVAADPTVSNISITSITGAYAGNGGTLYGGADSAPISSAPPKDGSNRIYGIGGFAASSTWKSGASYAGATLVSYPGLGMSSDSSGSTQPNHALDNGPATRTTASCTDCVYSVGNTEAVILQFSSSVVLNNIGLSWASNGTTSSSSTAKEDLSVFRWVGTAPASGVASINGIGTTLNSGGVIGAANLVTTGWTLVGNYADLTTAAAGNAIDAGTVGSSWWMISAYNTGYGATSKNGGTLEQGDDYFKIVSVAGALPSQGGGSAPEPGSLALVTLAIGSAWSVRRRRPGSGGMALAAA